MKIGQNLNFSRQHFPQTTDILTVFCTNFVKIGQNVKLSRQHFQQTMKITQHARGLSRANFKSHCVKSLENSLFIPAFGQYRQHNYFAEFLENPKNQSQQIVLKLANVLCFYILNIEWFILSCGFYDKCNFYNF